MGDWLSKIGSEPDGTERLIISDIPEKYSSKLALDFQFDYDVQAWTNKELQAWANSNNVEISPDIYAAIQDHSAYGNCFLLMFYPDKDSPSWSGDNAVEVLQLSTDDEMFKEVVFRCPRGWNYCNITRMVAD
jgi:hypothetical protein